MEFHNGQQIGKYILLDIENRRIGSQYRRIAKLKCVCGTISEMRLDCLKRYKNKRDYCTCKEIKGLSSLFPEERQCYDNMIGRCYTPTNNRYSIYGGRGIKVCDEWRYSFTKFINDMGKKPTSNHSLDRERVNEDYSKNNCRWATVAEQAVNRRNNVYIEHEGIVLTIGQWERLKNLWRGAINYRTKHLKWSMDKAINTPHERKPKSSMDGRKEIRIYTEVF